MLYPWFIMFLVSSHLKHNLKFCFALKQVFLFQRAYIVLKEEDGEDL